MHASTDQLDEVEMVSLAGPLQVDPAMRLAFFGYARTEPVVVEELDDRALEDASSDAGFNVRPAAALDDHRIDAVLGEEVCEQQPSRTGSDDGDFGLDRSHGTQ
jgi:hypothetical protein